MREVRRKLRLKVETVAQLTGMQLKQVCGGVMCTDTCDMCWSLALTCQGNTCTALVRDE